MVPVSMTLGVSDSGAIHDFDPCLWTATLLDNTAPVERSTVRGSVFSFDHVTLCLHCIVVVSLLIKMPEKVINIQL